MKAMIFAAGLGTRFKPWTDTNPKALAVVNGKSLLQRNVEYLQQYGITDVVVNVHHFADQVIAAIKQAGGWGSNIVLSDESDVVLETGGGLLQAKNLLGNSPFITVNADILTTLNLHQFASAHQENGALISLAVAQRDTTRFLLFNDQNRLCGWRNVKEDAVSEKIALPAAHYIQKAYSGLAIFEPTVFSLIPFTGKFSLIDVFLHLAPHHLITGYDHSGDAWVDVGRPESVAVAEALFS
ncbi:MAG TPA: nucleotidyltransferase family protein [Chitinophagaceae bacterium]|nr:nucleotidyltransferase family protein [Chitinophagaceae bacterium]